nr:uncharacterized protein LOC117992024 [Maniola hyperantus]
MNLIYVAAFIAACGAATLDRTYLPPSSSQYAGGTPGSSQTSGINGVNQGFLQTPFGRTSDNSPSQGNQLPSGSYENEYQGVVVEAAAPGTRASNQPSGLGGLRENYGSTDSKVGEAAFRGTKNQARPQNGGIQNQAQFESFRPQGSVGINNQDYPDLSAFNQPSGQNNAGNRPGNQLFTDRMSNTVKYHMNIGLNKFNYGFETENGIKMEENGVSNDGDKRQGGYSYTGDDGKVYSVVYTADKNGYRPMGSHLPTPPPIPAEILESLQQNAKDEANGIKDDGSYDAQKYNAEDDYAQSDTNGNYNDRQSNKFGERPGFHTGASAVINQDQQGFVRPNGQGHFSSYDFSKDSSSTQPDNSKLGTGVAGFDNSGRPNEVQRPGSNAGASTFFNQHQQGIVRPNVQFSSYDLPSTQPDTSKFVTDVNRVHNTLNKGNIFLAQNGQTTQFGNRFGAQSQYLPPRPPGNFLDANSFLQIDSSKVGFNNNFNNAQPHAEQKFQDQGPFGRPIQSLTTQNSYGTFLGQGSPNENLPPSIQGSNSFGININNNSPQNDGAFFQTGLQSSLISSNLGSEFDRNAQNSPTNSGEVYEYTKPVQGLPASSQEENSGDSSSEINKQNSVTLPQNEDTIKPQNLAARQAFCLDPKLRHLASVLSQAHHLGSKLPRHLLVSKQVLYLNKNQHYRSLVYNQVHHLDNKQFLQDLVYNLAQKQNSKQLCYLLVYKQAQIPPVKKFGIQLPQLNNQFGVQTELAKKDITPSQQSQGDTQFDQQYTAQSDKQSFSSISLNKDASKPNQQSQVAIFPRFPDQSKVTNSPFESGKPTTSQFVVPISSIEQNSESEESTSSEFSSTSTDNTQYQPPTPFPSSSSQNSFDLQKQEQLPNSQSGELYQYNKPVQSFPDASQNKFDTTKPIVSHLSQSNEQSNDELPMQSDEDVSQPQTVNKPQTPSSSTLGTLPSAHPFPQLAFYSACCRGPKPQGSSLSGKIPSSHLIGNLGANSFGLNKNTQDTNGSGIENKFGNQSFGVRKDTPSFAGQGEEFGGSRKPPKFDETGYHY